MATFIDVSMLRPGGIYGLVYASLQVHSLKNLPKVFQRNNAEVSIENKKTPVQWDHLLDKPHNKISVTLIC